MYRSLCHESPQQLSMAGSLAATRAPRHILQLSHRGSPSVESDCHGAPCHSQSLCGRVLGVVDERGCLERSTRRFLFSVGPYVSNGLRPESTVRLIRVVCVWAYSLRLRPSGLRVSIIALAGLQYASCVSFISTFKVAYLCLLSWLKAPAAISFFRGMTCVNRV